MLYFFAVLGVIWVIIGFLSIILHIAQFIYNRKNEKEFEKKIKNNRVLENIFKTLTPDQIKTLKDGGRVEESIDVIKKTDDDNEYLNLIMDKFKEYKVGNMEQFTKELENWVKLQSASFNGTIYDWYRILSDTDNKTLFTFTVFRDNVFALFAHNVDKGKAIDTITSFNKISDFENLLKTNYKCNKFVKEQQ